MNEGCGVLFMLENGSGIIICGQKRADGNCFLCKRCLKEKSGETNHKEVDSPPNLRRSKNVK